MSADWLVISALFQSPSTYTPRSVSTFVPDRDFRASCRRAKRGRKVIGVDKSADAGAMHKELSQRIKDSQKSV